MLMKIKFVIIELFGISLSASVLKKRLKNELVDSIRLILELTSVIIVLNN